MLTPHAVLADVQALLGALPPLFGGGQLSSCELTSHPQASMSAASFEQLQHSWLCHAAPASLWRCQPWLTAPAALAQASLPAVTRSLADKTAAAAAAASMTQGVLSQAAAADDSGSFAALFQAADVVAAGTLDALLLAAELETLLLPPELCTAAAGFAASHQTPHKLSVLLHALAGQFQQ